MKLNVLALVGITVSGLAVYGIILSGWASNSRYAFFGALRSAAQMVSYEVSIGLILVSILICVGSLNFIDIVFFQNYLFFVIPFFPLFLMFLVSILAETNRAPFDLPEAESELVSGFNVEYASMGFALFFLAEYGSIILMSALTVILFFGG
jgi:NADH-quinone oxidoreductase subunit H